MEEQDTVVTKRCTKCGVEKPLGEFGKQKTGKYGHTAMCKQCTNEISNKYYRDKKNGTYVSRIEQRVKDRFDNRRIEGDLEECVNAKVCCVCGKLLPHAMFNTRPHALDRLDNRCKSCQSKKAHDRTKGLNYERPHTDTTLKQMIDGVNAKICPRCGNLKFYDDFGSQRNRKDGMQLWCKECKNVRSSEHQKENRTRYNAYATKRRAAFCDAVPEWLTDDDWSEIDAIYLRAGEISAKTGITHHVDHIYPLQPKDGPGGIHEPCNLQIIPFNENIEKRNKVPEFPPDGKVFVKVLCNGIEKIAIRCK